MANVEQNTVREGILAGLLSATVIAAWLLVVDMIAGHALFTPRVLGRGLIGMLGIRAGDTTAFYVIAYTVFHYVTFCIIGVIVSVIVSQARRTPAVLAGFLIMFIVFEFGFYGLASMLSVNSDLQGLAWYQIGLANLLATLVMFYFMWARHPELKAEIRSALEGTDA